MEKNQLHHIGRRDFLKIVGISTASASLTACGGGDQSVAEDPVLGPVPTDQMTHRINPSTQDKVSILGYGCMRWPLLPEPAANGNVIDQETVNKLVDYALAHGVNYFDTAWGYHGETSELVAGRLLSAYPRESYYLASKFPGYDNANMDKVKSIFARQLEKCRTSYFDFYMFHNVYEGNIDDYLDPRFGIMEHLLEQKQRGAIRHLGFSAHGGMDVLKRFLDAYGEHMEFCQLQVNYMDWHFQDA